MIRAFGYNAKHAACINLVMRDLRYNAISDCITLQLTVTTYPHNNAARTALTQLEY